MVFAVAAFLYARREVARGQVDRTSEELDLRDRRQSVDREAEQVLVTAREEAFRLRGDAETEGRDRRAEVARLEQRVSQREEGLERRLRELEQSEQRLTRREEELEEVRVTTESERSLVGRELERVAGLTQQDARAELLASVEQELDSEVAERIRAADARVRAEAGERSREILIAAMQRHASDQTGESSVTVMHLPSDELKGRIIGREGRNIRALEAATGVDVIVDETPETVVLSGFDPVRREVARVTLERLFADGRIHPARIEEMVGKSRSEIIQRIREEGDTACQELGLPPVHPELAKLLGTLRFRNSYGHNVLSHSKDTAAIAGMIAAEIGYDEQEAKEIGLFHDIGHAVEHTVEGSHALIGGEILARLGRPAAVVQAVKAHHYDEEPRSIGAFIVMTADAIAATRRGARREPLAAVLKRIERIEAIANSFEGVERSFAVQAGKELRVMVRPHEVSDDRAQVLARQIAKRLHAEGSYQGRLKVVVLRETRSVEYAK
ncbi:MAG: ribonuclease Y [Candidatus Dormibacteraeota bacterium]|nr:ribonuclease Y [Candidatus Dormibacteraeota bacterium]